MTLLPKSQRIVSKRWTQASKGQPCTLQIPTVCIDSYPHETTVPCHLPGETKGTAYKNDDTAIVDGCTACHRAIDGDWERETNGMTEADKYWFMLRALQRTLRNRHDRGIGW